jgi:nucleoid-associated protein YgaU
MAEIGLVGAEVMLTYYGGETRVDKTFHDGPAQFSLPVGTQVVGVSFLGAGDGNVWKVTNVSQKTVNEPASSQFAFNFPLPPAGPGSTHVLLVGVAQDGAMALADDGAGGPVASTAGAPAVAAGGDSGYKDGAVAVYVYHDVNEDGIWNWGEVTPPNLRGDHAWKWDYPCTEPGSPCEQAEIGLVAAEVMLAFYGGETRTEKTFHDGPAQFSLPHGQQVIDVQIVSTPGGKLDKVTNVSQKTVNEPADSQFAFNFPLPPAGPNYMKVLLIGVAEDSGEDSGSDAAAVTTYTVEAGDTLNGIAQAFGTTVSALVSTNDIADADVIQPGKVLIIP